MGNPITEAVERAVDRLVADFQCKSNANRSWNERDLHWSLFYYLKQERIVQEDYPTQLIRAEFPTVKKYDGARGYYDLVVLDRASWLSEVVQAMKPWDSWDEYFKFVKVLVAVEIKLWQARLNPKDPVKRVENWDIRKLTDTDNKVSHPYFLSFVQLRFDRPEMREYYQKLRAGLAKINEMRPDLKILCVPSDTAIQSDPNDNWLSLSRSV